MHTHCSRTKYKNTHISMKLGMDITSYKCNIVFIMYVCTHSSLLVLYINGKIDLMVEVKQYCDYTISRITDSTANNDIVVQRV